MVMQAQRRWWPLELIVDLDDDGDDDKGDNDNGDDQDNDDDDA